jgi:hypothetical protein
MIGIVFIGNVKCVRIVGFQNIIGFFFIIREYGCCSGGGSCGVYPSLSGGGGGGGVYPSLSGGGSGDGGGGGGYASLLCGYG